ncbi:MAG: hypothetical protein QOI80_1414 [Solirubrobacteraceae bacterium]|nr:hypothetical protein [Solirubrobacteraceae bacterium]
MTTSQAGPAELLDLLWVSETLFAARLDADGVVLAANPALQQWAGGSVTGMAVAELAHPGLAAAVADAGDTWTRLATTFETTGLRPAEDRTVLLRRHGDEVLLVAEVARDRLIERVRRLEAITLQGLTRPDLPAVLAALLDVVRDVLDCAGAAVLLRDDRTRALARAAGAGPEGTPRERVALLLDDERIGVLEVSGPRAGAFSAEDRALLQGIAERAALAIGHGQMRIRERVVAEALQRSVLPSALPVVPAVGLCARYLPLTSGFGVGGDFYDALALDDGRLAVSIGDVAGKGLRAASTMGRLCHALRAYAIEGGEPADVLDRLDRLTIEDGEEMATAQHLILDAAAGELVYANAGHPPALRIHASGATEWLGEALSPPLGAGVGDRPQATARLERGDRLLLYTDGLIERRGETLDVGLEALAASVAGTRGADELCHAAVDAMAGPGGFEDDVAVIALEVRGGA